MKLAAKRVTAPFAFERDTLAFANELVWQYSFDPITGRTSIRNSDPPPTYSHRCFVLVRSVRQFLFHARFDPDSPRTTASSYHQLVARIVSRSARQPSEDQQRIVVPGYPGLREFSRDGEAILKAECGGPVQSYFVRSHWRMVFPVTRRHQERMAKQLTQAIVRGKTPIVHLFRFPRIAINHGVLLFGFEDNGGQIQFDVYDPNIPEHAITLNYLKSTRTFDFPPTKYWAGGPLNVYEMFLGGLY